MTVTVDLQTHQVAIATERGVYTEDIRGRDQAEVLAELVQKAGVEGSQATLLLRPNHSFSRVLSLERVPAKKNVLDAVIGAALEETLPVDLEELSFSYVPLQNGNELNPRFLATAVQTDKAKDLFDIVNRAGLSARRLVAYSSAASTVYRLSLIHI